MPNIGDKDARFERGAKVKIYLGVDRFIGTGIVEKEIEPEKKGEQYTYEVKVGDGTGTYFANELLPQRFDFGDIKKIALKVHEVNDSDFRKGEIWQAILNVGYDKWRTEDGRRWSYADMVNWVRLEYGEFASFCILIGKYNQQVTNGGHIQYWDNRYAGDDEEDFELHDDMVYFFKRSGLTDLELGKRTFEVIRDFKIVFPEHDRWGGCGCDCCCGECNEPYVSDPSLDNRYYDFCHDWVKVFDKIVAEEIRQAYREAQVAA